MLCQQAGPATVSESSLVAGIWGEDDAPAHPAKALQVVVSRARAATDPGAIVHVAGGYRIGLGPDEVDVFALAATVAAAIRAEHSGDAVRAEVLFGEAAGHVVTDGPDTVLGDVRAHARVLVSDARLRHAVVASGLGHHEAALAVLEAAGDDDRVVLARLRSVAAVRGVPAALSEYDAYRNRLANRLGVDPAPEVQALHKELLVRDRPVRSGLSHYASSLVGRDDDLTRLRALVHTHRVVSILGPGGLGKTRLAQLVASEADQPVVHVVELVGITDPADVVAEVGSVLGVRDSVRGRSGLSPEQVRDIRARIAQQLSQAPSLLVLDNCEHLIAAVADLVAFLVAAVPSLRVLTTTRAPLAIAAEHVFDLSRLGADDAAALFCQRAVAARAGVVLPDDAVQAVVDRLDGLPLAIELAAVKVRAMAVDDIAVRLENRFALLRGGDRSAPDRHQTLLAVIDWSWNLLADEHRRGLRRLSVFHDGFTLQAAEEVLDTGALDTITELVDQSLLTVLDHGDGVPVRYRMLETVREFGRMQLIDAGEQASAQAAHGAWAVGVADLHRDALFSRDQVATIDAIAVEENNLADALRKALIEPDPDAVVALVSTLGGFWSIRGEHGRMILLVESLSEVLTDQLPSEERTDQTRAALSMAIINAWIAHPAVLTDLHALLSRVGPGTTSPTVAAIVTVVLAIADEGDRARAAALTESPDPIVRAVALQWFSHERENSGDLEGAVHAAEDALAIIGADAGPWNRAVMQTQLAGLYSQLGRFDAAQPHAEAAVPVLLRLGARDDALQTMAVIATCRLMDDDLAGAERTVEEITLLQAPGALGAAGAVLTTRAEIAFARGDTAGGCRLMRESAESMSAIRFPGMGPDADLAPWTIYGRSVATVAYATHGTGQEGRDLYDSLAASAPRAIDPARTFLDVPVTGLMLLALGTWGLRRATMDPGDAVRLLVIADRCAYPRFAPTVAWPRAVELAEATAPGVLATIESEYAERRGLALLDEARDVIARLR